MNKLKVCMVTTFYPPYNFGGDGVFVQRLANALSRQGHEVHVIHDRDAYALGARSLPDADLSKSSAPSESGIKIHTLGNGDPDSFDLILTHQLGRPIGKSAELKKILESENFDVIHSHNISLLGGPEILKYGRAVMLVTLHDHWFVCAMHVLWRNDSEACTKRTCLSCTVKGKRPPQVWRYTGAIADAARHVHAFLAPSEFARKSHLANGFPAAIRVLPHFLPERQEAQVAATEANSDNETGRPYFFFAGRLEKLKGVQVLIEQFRSYKGADLIIAGTGAYESELRALAAGCDNIKFAGRVDQNELQSLYKNAIAVIVPSLCYETFGLVALEAFAVSTPVLVNNLGALPELVQSGGGGLAYSDADDLRAKIQSLAQDPQMRKAFGQKGYENYRSNYTEDKHLRRYYELINELKGARSMQEVS